MMKEADITCDGFLDFKEFLRVCKMAEDFRASPQWIQAQRLIATNPFSTAQPICQFVKKIQNIILLI